MLRKLLILGVFAGTSASIPIVYQSNPQFVENLLKSAAPGKQAVEAQPNVNLASVPDKPVASLPMGRKVVVAADERGHFSSAFKLNGRQIDGMIDTGATLVAIPSTEARRLGIDFEKGQRGYSSTAGGVVPTYRVKLDSVTVGGITLLGVEASVLDVPGMDFLLLGNSFLSRTEMRREGTTLTLTKRF